MSTVTGIAEGRVAILVTVDAFRLSDAVLNSKMSTVTGIAEGRLAIRVIVDVFRLSDDVLNSKMSTITGIAEGRVAMLVTVDVFSTVGQCSKLKNVDSYRDRGRQGRHPRNCRCFSTLGCCSKLKNVDSYRDRGRQARHPRNCRRFWTLNDSHTCLEIQKCRLPVCETSNKMRTCRFLLSFARFCGNMSFSAQRC